MKWIMVVGSLQIFKSDGSKSLKIQRHFDLFLNRMIAALAESDTYTGLVKYDNKNFFYFFILN